MATIRGLFTFNGVLHAVRDAYLYRVDNAGTTTYLATLNSGGGPVDMEQNLSQLVITDGTALYVWDGSSLSITANWTAGDRIAFVDQRIVGIRRGTQQYAWTALGDANTAAALDFKSAEGSPDRLVSLVAAQRELLLLGEDSGELHYSVGGTAVFERASSEFIQYGCAAAFSAVLVGGIPFWLGRDRRGQAQVLASRGQRISTRAIEERFEGLDLAQARAYSYSDGGQHFYCLNVPNVETTLVFDRTFGQWHERAELTNGEYSPWRPTCHAFAYGSHWFGDDTGNLYRLDKDAHTFAGSTKVRDRIAPVVSSPIRGRMRFPSLEVICEKATNATVMLRWSDDNGANWSNWHHASTGDIGKYAERIRFTRLGSAYDRVFQLRMTDQVAFNPIGARLEAV
jgi:hypothetical protein